jgi:hypothetical protein
MVMQLLGDWLCEEDSDHQQHSGLTVPASSLGIAFPTDMLGLILTKGQSTDIINCVQGNDNCKFRESESAVLSTKLVIWEVIGKTCTAYILYLWTMQSGQHHRSLHINVVVRSTASRTVICILSLRYMK